MTRSTSNPRSTDSTFRKLLTSSAPAMRQTALAATSTPTRSERSRPDALPDVAVVDDDRSSSTASARVVRQAGTRPMRMPLQNGHGERKEQHARIERRFVDPRHVDRSVQLYHADQRRSHHQADDARDGGQDQAVDDRLKHESQRMGAGCAADREFTVPPCPSRQQQVRDVDARDEEDQADRGQISRSAIL